MRCIVPTIQNTVIIPFIILRLSTSLLLLLLFLLRTFRTCLVSWWFQGRHAAAAAGRIGMAAEKRTSHPFHHSAVSPAFLSPSLALSLSLFPPSRVLPFTISLLLLFLSTSLCSPLSPLSLSTPLNCKHYYGDDCFWYMIAAEICRALFAYCIIPFLISEETAR